MKLYIIFLVLAYSTLVNAQIELKIKKCFYSEGEIHLKINIKSNFHTVKTIDIDSSNEIVQMPYNTEGDEFWHRMNSNVPNAFVLFYLNDTLIKDFKFYWKGMTFFTKLHIPSRSSIKREYFVRVIGDTTKKLLDEKSNNLTVNFFLVYKLNGMKANAMAKPVKITYK